MGRRADLGRWAGQRAAVILVASGLMVAAVTGPVTAGVPHQHLIVGQEFVGSGTLSKNYTGSPVGLWGAGLGYPVRSGDTITWTNMDVVPHTVTACVECEPYPRSSGLFNSGFLTFGSSWTLNTAGMQPGTYTYYCIHHVFLMRGSFVVLG